VAVALASGGPLLAVALAGCDPLAGSDYVGEPLFTVHGTFASKANAPGAPVGGVALLWQDAHGAGGPGIAATAVPVSIEFPAAFDVSVPAPPPEGARFSLGGAVLAEAYVYVVGDVNAPRTTTRGMDRDHVLVWAAGDVEAGSPEAEYVGGPMTAGYHLRRFQPVAVVAKAQAMLIERCVAGGGLRAACETRRAYQLEAITDAAPLRIEVSPP